MTTNIKNIEEAMAALGVTATTLTSSEKKALDEQGYIVVEGLVGRKWLEQMRAEFERLWEEDKRAAGSDLTRKETGTRHINNLIHRSAAFEDVFTHPKLLAAIYQVLGREFRSGGAHGRDPLPGFGQQALHADAVPRTWGEPFYSVTSLWMLDDFTIENGATRVVPGTHREVGRLPKNLSAPSASYPGQLQVVAPAGSVLIFNAHLWHSGMVNRSRVTRRSLQVFHYARGSMFGTGEKPTAPEGASPAARYLLGA